MGQGGRHGSRRARCEVSGDIARQDRDRVRFGTIRGLGAPRAPGRPTAPGRTSPGDRRHGRGQLSKSGAAARARRGQPISGPAQARPPGDRAAPAAPDPVSRGGLWHVIFPGVRIVAPSRLAAVPGGETGKRHPVDVACSMKSRPGRTLEQHALISEIAKTVRVGSHVVRVQRRARRVDVACRAH